MRNRHRKKSFIPLPALWLMTDERVEAAALLAAAARLPKGHGGIVFRHYRTEPAARRALFEALRAIARRRRLILLLAGSAREGAAWRADGVHGRDMRGSTRPMLRSRAVHDTQEAVAARRVRADLCFVSPLFPTRSHPGAGALGRVRFAALARQVKAPVMALGGVRQAHRMMLDRLGADGWAAIDGLTL
ncbi:thiamine phosphate synthase [Sphingobium sp. CR2-8]|uniref:thiamine phosphate synthase n=1 Tax=Sphingobium sp. CR2-8 TaxID=1306534 RepID=UPI002DBCB9E6|nr:thiamine phosphate synthase [Sphingobium sp. CR2-8]MEC3912861.1 thiamine phosphate synthase [Sphingobium sp. CR2-8]